MFNIYEEVINYLIEHASDKNTDFYKRIGITSKILGVKAPIIKAMSKTVNKNLMNELWNSGIEECRRLAIFISDNANPNIKEWIKDCNSWSIVDCLCGELLWKFDNYDEIIEYCILCKEEYQIRVAIVLCIYLAKKRKITNIDKYIPIVNQFSLDKRNFVKKAVIWFNKEINKC